MIYATNAIENLNITIHRLNHQCSVFPSDTAFFKALYLSSFEENVQYLFESMAYPTAN
ncbi:transposase [Intestinibacter bartlettii]|uniref:transposase n=1 Tax=Intestinibacter bartlettii TaxID=261299 RepID=UPI00399235BC